MLGTLLIDHKSPSAYREVMKTALRIAVGMSIIIAGGMVAGPPLNVMLGESEAVIAYPAIQMVAGIIVSSIGAGVACAHPKKD